MTFAIPLDLPGVLAIMPRPRNGEWLNDDLRALVDRGVHIVVSLLESAEEQELGLEREAAVGAASGLLFIAALLPDGGVPAAGAQFTRLVVESVGQLQVGQHVVLHCRQSIGRGSATRRVPGDRDLSKQRASQFGRAKAYAGFYELARSARLTRL